MGRVSLTESEGVEALEGTKIVAAYGRCASVRDMPSLGSRRCSEIAKGSACSAPAGRDDAASVHLALPAYDRRAVDGLHMPIEAISKIAG